ncbi:MAG: hypothetical protein IPG59_12265 [Candidatus Melainabacteria bacterium]|nr:MAG: hypothetical protein IPG59_12265 [Candidatus Melainabacteria bacterium]
MSTDKKAPAEIDGILIIHSNDPEFEGLATNPHLHTCPWIEFRHPHDFDNLYYDPVTGFHGQLQGQLIDGPLAPVHIITGDRELTDAVYTAEPGAVFHCGNHALVAAGQHWASVWQKEGVEFRLVPEAFRIPEPPTYADIRKD